jgi:hypothetical protein
MIQGVPGPAPLPDPRTIQPREPGPATGGSARPAPSPTPPPTRTPEAPARPEAAAGAPEGVDPKLWSVLTTEERAFFQRSRARGPLTYGPSSDSRGPAAPPAGGRLDIRV